MDLKSKARRYDQRRAKEQERINILNQSKSPEQRKLNAQKAAKARWSK